MRLCSLLTLGVLAVVAAPADAHHSFAMFDYTKTVTWEGTVDEFGWYNPHVKITVVVASNAADPALAGRWAIEGAATNIMSRQGWNKSSFAKGDRITIVGYAMKDGSKGGTLYYAIDSQGNKLYHDINRRPGVG